MFQGSCWKTRMRSHTTLAKTPIEANKTFCITDDIREFNELDWELICEVWLIRSRRIGFNFILNVIRHGVRKLIKYMTRHTVCVLDFYFYSSQSPTKKIIPDSFEESLLIFLSYTLFVYCWMNLCPIKQ